MKSCPKSKNQGRIYHKSTCRGFLKVYAVDFIIITATKWLRVRRRYWFILKKHAKLRETNYLFVENEQELKKDTIIV